VTPYVDDRDFTLYVGDVREVLAGLPDGSVDCVVTSRRRTGGSAITAPASGRAATPTATTNTTGTTRTPWPNYDPARPAPIDANGHSRNETKPVRDVCGKCGASRVDRQIGLEATPELFVQQMVEVFREVRRVLAAHGTCWVNLGDSYDANPPQNEQTDGFKGRGTSADGKPMAAVPPRPRPEAEGSRRHPVACRVRPAGGRLVAALRHRVGEAEPDARVGDGPADEERTSTCSC
jgi:hypothetical protein